MAGTASGEKTAAMAPKVEEHDFGQAAETPSGKGAGDENFPVGSWLLPARLRPHVAKFYAAMCPAEVYELVDGKLRINAPNCVDCKATDVLGPRWTPREGGSGPRYRRM